MEVLQRTANRGSVSTGYDIDNSVKLEDANDEYFTRTNASGTNQRTWTVSFWCKRTKLSTADGLVMELWDGGVYSEATRIGFGLNNDELWYDIGYSSRYRGQSTRQFTDTNAWYHIVVAWDTTDGTAADRVKIYVNGERETSFSGSPNYPSSSQDIMFGIGGSYPIVIGRRGTDDAEYFDGLMSHFHRVDNQALAQTVFGSTDSTTGEWKINTSPSITYTGSSSFNFFVLMMESLKHLKNQGLKMVRAKGVEPSRPKAPEPKSGASTNSATRATKDKIANNSCRRQA